MNDSRDALRFKNNDDTGEEPRNVSSDGGAIPQAAMYRRSLSTRWRSWMSERLSVVPYSVLGTALSAQSGGFSVVEQAGLSPTSDIVIVDPAGLPYVSGARPPARAGAASGSIYDFLGIRDAPRFPDEVSSAITAPGLAKLHAYGDGDEERRCIHVVGIDFRERADLDAAGALSALAETYANVLREAAFSAAPIATLRLLPISGGVFAARWASEIHHLTFAALFSAFEDRLSSSERAALVSNVGQVHMCIFLQKEVGLFERALAWRAPPSRGPQ